MTEFHQEAGPLKVVEPLALMRTSADITRRMALLGLLGVVASIASAAGAEEKRPLMPDVLLKNLDGSLLRLSEFRGEVLLLNFWASWCGPCMQELPLLESLHRKLAAEKGIRILAVNLDEGVSGMAIESLWKRGGFSMRVVMDPSGASAAAFGIRMLPMTFVTDSRGAIRHSIAGARDWNDPQWERGLKAFRDGKAP